MIIKFIFITLLIAANIYLFIKSISNLNLAKSLKLKNQEEQSHLDFQIKSQLEELNRLYKSIEISKINFKSEQDRFETYYKNEEEQLEKYKKNIKELQESYFNCLETNYDKKEKEYFEQIKKIEKEKNKINEELLKLKNSLTAGIEAQLREKEKEEKLDFYTLQLDIKTKNEVSAIKQIEYILSDPRPLRMLIWTTYYSKKANDLCARILGNKKITGIYRITNMITKQCYIGQAKDVKERWREHMKCGLGIDTPAGNKLYKSMLEDGLDNFTFELIEECLDKDLNEKEKFFINLYQSYDFGFNSTKGNK